MPASCPRPETPCPFAEQIKLIQATHDAALAVQTELACWKKQQDELAVTVWGKDGSNGLRGTVSKHKVYWRAVLYVTGVIVTVGLTWLVTANLDLLRSHPAPPALSSKGP